MPQLNQDLSGVTEEDMGGGSWRALPDGEYTFHVTESEYKETQAGNGMVLKLVWECITPNVSARLWDFLTLEHPNEQTTSIARARLKEAAIAVGHPNPDYLKASEELHHKPAVLKLKRVVDKKYGDSTGHKNEILGYKPVGGGGGGRTSEAEPPSDDDIPF